ncbi:C45 family autoproteolytic acyltransferase/hydolase [Fulvivirga ligni]|uniref:C45 family autoproteolytic acyltransferase/hydolase n=1 Tax=Fulvivirga ligni TaxID=2904246 RepID=UPI001F1854FE|nr:C45 family peptidase [Fulvivirga ligni]UII22965.1 C45 family peptidase [Fulvivirga ligni]
MRKKILIGLLSFIILVVGLCTVYYFMVKATPPVNQEDLPAITVTKSGENSFVGSDGSWLKKNDQQVWEMYVHGGPLERGVAFGELCIPLQKDKEEAFIAEIRNKVPSDSYLNFLKYLIGWFNRDLDKYVPEEYLKEIYASSRYMPDEYDYIAPKYQRALSYHAAHDIGHALQNMNLVGCTSFAVRGDKSENSKLLLGRNFDFYFGEDFAQDRMVAFYNPDQGYKFMSITWACFSGVVSGMNEKGLSITLNSDKSAIPSKGTTPVSLMARQMLQYASNIEEAYEIAKSYDTFVAESFLIGSKEDGRAALIEKTPEKTALYQEDDMDLVVTNHYQSDELKNDELNQEYLSEGVSDYRYERVQELLDSLSPMNVEKTAYLLRDKRGLGGKDIGLANEKAINQLLAHHSVIFSPEELKVWVSAPPYQLGKYLAYDLNEIFSEEDGGHVTFSYIDSLSLDKDPFYFTEDYKKFRDFVATKAEIQKTLARGEGDAISEAEQQKFIASNPNGYLTYYYLGDYNKSLELWSKAKKYYNIALQLEIARKSERDHILEGLKECEEHLN